MYFKGYKWPIAIAVCGHIENKAVNGWSKETEKCMCLSFNVILKYTSGMITVLWWSNKTEHDV